MRISNEPLGDLLRARNDMTVATEHIQSLVNLQVFNIEPSNLNTTLSEVRFIIIFIIQAAVVIIRKIYCAKNEKKSIKIS